MLKFPRVTCFAFIALFFAYVPAFGEETLVISYGDSWRYSLPASDPGNAWRQVGYNDAGWSSGPGLFGFESAPLPPPGIQTPVGTPGNQITYLFRKTFSYTGNPAGVRIRVNQVVDDGVVYYLNGNRIKVIRLTPGGAWNEGAVGVGDAALEANAVDTSAIGLINGANVLCAEVHQTGVGSSDLVFGAEVFLSPPEPPISGKTEYVIFVSVDGLRGDFLESFINDTALQPPAQQEFPGFLKLKNASAYTFNARCEFGVSDTSPNHTSMITGRWAIPREPGDTSYHGYMTNAWDGVATLTDYNGPADPSTPPNPGVYKSSIFDNVHDHGLSTAMLLGKEKLLLFNATYNEDNGATDLIPPDNGRKKIDYLQYILNFAPDPDYYDSTSLFHGSTIQSNPNGIGAGIGVIAQINGQQLRNFTFIHMVEPDIAGHSDPNFGGGWISSPGNYRNSVKVVDGLLKSMFEAVQASNFYKNKTSIILTADHGGGYDLNAEGQVVISSHRKAERIENYTIPMFVYGPGFAGNSDLYSYFENRFNPGTSRPTLANNVPQPLHNGDIANIAAALLGLPPVTGSMMKPEFKKPLQIIQSPGAVTLSWPDYLTDFSLEFSDALTTPTWNSITSGILNSNGAKQFSETIPSGSQPPKARFYRLKKP